MPDWMPPTLATLTTAQRLSGPYVYERKLDGVRAIAYKDGRDVRLFSRNRKRIDAEYVEIAQALKRIGGDFVIDGEIVALDKGRTSFALLQQRMGVSNPVDALVSKVPVEFHVFDILSLGGKDLRGLPLLERKRALAQHIDLTAPLHYVDHEEGDGLIEAACARGWEGLIAKRKDSAYAGRRTRDWLKLKCGKQQEFVIGGFTEPKGTRSGIGALLLGYHEGIDLRYAGKVGTGFSDDILRDLRARLGRIEQDRSPFVDTVREKTAHFTAPELVCEVAFTEWTGDGKLRHPRYLGLREDKPVEEVVRERAVA